MGIRDGIKELFSSKDDMDYPSYERRVLSGYGRSDGVPVMEMVVPLCCDNCEKKVRNALEEMDGVADVDTDRDSNRVTVTGFVDPIRALRRVRKLKPKSELHGGNTFIAGTSHDIERIDPRQPRSSDSRYVSSALVHDPYPGAGYGDSGYGDSGSGKRRYVARTATVLTPVGATPGPQLVRVNSHGRRMHRLNSFGRFDRDRDDAALVPVDLQRDYYHIRRMPSLGRHRFHDAEYISAGDQFHPMPDSRFVSHYSQRAAHPVFRSQVSFSKLPVTNPHYIKRIENEYNY